jgi:ketosteroid isomerase-like protein
LLVDGQDAVVLGTLADTAARTGRAYEAAFALHVTVERGEIVRHHAYEDSLAVWTAFSPAGAGSAGVGR